MNRSFAITVLLAVAAAPALAGADAPLRVCATTTDLASLVREVGGDQVEVTTFAKGTDDPHFVEAKPSFIKALAGADLFVQSGLELEVGWAPALLKSARNAKVLPGASGFLDASTAVEPREIPSAVDRSMGDVHALGNPHYMADPINGLRVAELIAGKLAELRPEARPVFTERLQSFRQRLGAALVGETLASRYDVAKLAELHARGKLADFLATQGESELLTGWLGTLRRLPGTKAVADHNLWPYFAHRFGLVLVGFLEPKPGISPTTAHLAEIVDMMRTQDVRLLLAAVYYNPRYSSFVKEKTGARVVELANQVGSRPGTDDYISMVAYNVRTLAEALP